MGCGTDGVWSRERETAHVSPSSKRSAASPLLAAPSTSHVYASPSTHTASRCLPGLTCVRAGPHAHMGMDMDGERGTPLMAWSV